MTEHQQQLNDINPDPAVAPVLGDTPMTMEKEFGYRIDHVPVTRRCCEMHNINCEPPGDLCCDDCGELNHYRGLEHSPCVLDRCKCASEETHLGTTQPGYAGNEIGMREPVDS